MLSVFLAFGCASSAPKDALDKAEKELLSAAGAQDCATETYELARKTLEEAQQAAKDGKSDLARQKAQTAQRLAEQAKSEAEMNKEECERRKNAQSAIQERLTEPVAEEEEVVNVDQYDFKVLYFDFDEYTVTTRAMEELQHNIGILQQHSGLKVSLAAHTDARGTTEYNLALSQKRGESVRAYLVNKGIDAARLSVVPYGKEKPASYGNTDQDYSLNRRVEFIPR